MGALFCSIKRLKRYKQTVDNTVNMGPRGRSTLFAFVLEVPSSGRLQKVLSAAPARLYERLGGKSIIPWSGLLNYSALGWRPNPHYKERGVLSNMSNQAKETRLPVGSYHALFSGTQLYACRILSPKSGNPTLLRL